jgi:hypothetical protein
MERDQEFVASCSTRVWLRRGGVWPAAARWFLTWPGRRVTDVPSSFLASSELAMAVVGEVAPARSPYPSPSTPLLRPQGCAGDACPRPAVRSQSRDFPSLSLSDGNTGMPTSS